MRLFTVNLLFVSNDSNVLEYDRIDRYIVVCYLYILGLDWGGVRREWIDLLSGILFGHEHNLFTRFKEEDAQALVSTCQLKLILSKSLRLKCNIYNFFLDQVHPNPRRPANLKLKYYEFAGRIVGKCLYESAVGAGRRQNIKAKFSRSFLAQLLGQRITYKVLTNVYYCS